MKFANVRELKNKTSEILRNAEKEAVIITSNGKPRAIVTAISEEDFEDYLLEKSPVSRICLPRRWLNTTAKVGTVGGVFKKKTKHG
jgi:prevent-host-death family protein